MLEQLIHRCISAYILQPLPLDCPNHCCCCLLHPHLPEPNTWINTSAPRPTSALVRILHQSSYIFDNTSISNFRCKRSNPCFFALFLLRCYYLLLQFLPKRINILSIEHDGGCFPVPPNDHVLFSNGTVSR